MKEWYSVYSNCEIKEKKVIVYLRLRIFVFDIGRDGEAFSMRCAIVFVPSEHMRCGYEADSFEILF